MAVGHEAKFGGEQWAGKEIYLEIGPGLRPAALRGDRQFTKGKVYFGVDAAEGDYLIEDGIDYGQRVAMAIPAFKEIALEDRPGEEIHFLQASAERLPFEDETVTEVFMANVVTAPIHPDIMASTLKEAKRVLKPEGQLVVLTVWDSWLVEPEEIISVLSMAGFQDAKAITVEKDVIEFLKLAELYGATHDVLNEHSYFCIAKKPFIATQEL